MTNALQSRDEKPAHFWKAEVAVTGVHAVADHEFEQLHAALPAVFRLDTHSGTLHLTWRFANDSPDISDAMSQASAAWREAVDLIENAADPVCTDYRVRRVDEM